MKFFISSGPKAGQKRVRILEHNVEKECLKTRVATVLFRMFLGSRLTLRIRLRKKVTYFEVVDLVWTGFELVESIKTSLSVSLSSLPVLS